MIRGGIYGFERGYAATLFEEEKPQTPAPDGSLVFRAYRVDCSGRGVPTDGAYKRVRTFPKYAKTEDHRTLKDMQAGCCPPQLMAEFIKTERFASEEGDAVAEALALHKRGYLGGAG